MPVFASRRRKLLVGVAVALVAGSAALLAAERHRLNSYWSDARSAVLWPNPLCTTSSAFWGLTKARRVTERTAEIMDASHPVRQDSEGLVLYATPFGEFWMPQNNDLWSLAVVLAEQEAFMYGEPGGLGVRPGDVVIDAGAHVGLFARAALAAGASKVITFEVTPNSNKALRRNLASAIADGKVIVYKKGVWHEEAMLPLVVNENCSACNSVTHRLPARFEVPLTTINHARNELKLNRVDFIKLDIENAEGNALRGARQVVEDFHPRIAVALENSKERLQYGHIILGELQERFAGYQYTCGAVTNPEKSERVLPEVLHLYTTD